VIKVTAVDLAAPGTAEQVRTFPGEVRQVRSARQFVGRVLAGCPARERLLTCVSELAANAIEHTVSGSDGTFTVAVGRPRDGVAFVAVTDAGGPGEPAIGEPDDEMAEDGRGLALVAAYSSRWGFRSTGHGRVVWAEATWPAPVGGAGGARGRAADLWQDSWTNPVERPGVA
jgi:anti-sigma regulatory factor (Ser/Thr protein kinase)